MAKVKLSLDRLSREQLRDLGQTVHDAIDGNANFATPNPPLADLQTAVSDLNTGIGELTAIRNEAEEKTVEVEGLADALKSKLSSLGSYVENASDGDEAKILSAGMDVRDEASPVTMTQVTGLEASPGDDSGEVDLTWDPMPGSKSYEVQTSPDPITATSWAHGDISTKSKLSLTGLPTGDKCWFRVRAVGASNKGAWSDPATKVVP